MGGEITYEYEGRKYSFDLEVAPFGFFVYVPKEVGALPKDERIRIYDCLLVWFAEVGFMQKAKVAPDFPEENESCLIAGCTFRRLKDHYVCRHHYEPSYGNEASLDMVRIPVGSPSNQRLERP